MSGPVTTKACLECEEVLPLARFLPHKSCTKDGHRNICQACDNRINEERVARNQDYNEAYRLKTKEKPCKRCKKVLPLGWFSPHKNCVGGLRHVCKPCVSRLGVEWQSRNREKQRNWVRQYQATIHGRLTSFYIDLKCGAKRRGILFDLPKGFLHELWEKQGGKCAVTGLPMVYDNRGKKDGKQRKTTTHTVSADRIDNTIGYVPGNVRLVCWFVNHMKGDGTDEELAVFIEHLHKCLGKTLPKSSTTLLDLFPQAA